MIYFFQAEGCGMIKIGSSDRVAVRLASLRQMSPVPLVCLGVMTGGLEEEREIHIRFRGLRSHYEWFHLGEELIEFIAKNAVPFDAPAAKEERKNRRSPDKTILYCPEGFHAWLIGFASERDTNISGLVAESASFWAVREGISSPPPLPKSILGIRPRRAPKYTSQVCVVGTSEWRQWFNRVADTMHIDVNKAMRAMIIAYAIHVGFTSFGSLK